MQAIGGFHKPFGLTRSLIVFYLYFTNNTKLVIEVATFCLSWGREGIKGGGEGSMGMCSPEDPLFTRLLFIVHKGSILSKST